MFISNDLEPFPGGLIMNWTSALVGAVIGVFSIGSASAAIVTSLSDDFTSNGQVAALNWTGDNVFKPVPNPPSPGSPSVDLVSSTTYPTLAPNASNAAAYPFLIGKNAVDLDGSEGNNINPAGTLQSVDSLALGNYLVSFYLAGNLRAHRLKAPLLLSVPPS